MWCRLFKVWWEMEFTQRNCFDKDEEIARYAQSFFDCYLLSELFLKIRKVSEKIALPQIEKMVK